jgi:hypothetical protein
MVSGVPQKGPIDTSQHVKEAKGLIKNAEDVLKGKNGQISKTALGALASDLKAKRDEIEKDIKNNRQFSIPGASGKIKTVVNRALDFFGLSTGKRTIRDIDSKLRVIKDIESKLKDVDKPNPMQDAFLKKFPELEGPLKEWRRTRHGEYNFVEANRKLNAWENELGEIKFDKKKLKAYKDLTFFMHLLQDKKMTEKEVEPEIKTLIQPPQNQPYRRPQ